MGLHKSLQQEWAFVKCITLDIGMAFQELEDELRYTVLPDLFQGNKSQIPGRAITGLPVKQAEIDLHNQIQTAGANWTASCVIKGHLDAAICRTDEFRPGDHALLMGEGREEIRWRHADGVDTTLGEAWAATSNTDAQLLGRI